MRPYGRGLVPALVITAVGCAGSGGPGAPGTFEDSAAFAIGANFGTGLLRQAPDVNVEQVIAGLRDAADDGETTIDANALQGVLERYAQQVSQDRRQAMEDAGTMHAQAGKEFLEENARRPEVTVTGSGLQYEVIRQGDGPRPEPTDVVQVHYRGTLIDGTEFDASDRNAEPVSFQLNRVISGWTEGVGLMAVGSVYKLYLPSELAYGTQGAPPDIPPNAALVFEVELVGIE